MLTADGARELAYRHPWLYHNVWKSDEEARCTIASDGLTYGKSRHNWHPLYKPRHGHVYLATHDYLNSWWLQSGANDDLYAVDTHILLASRINPDEDHFIDCNRFGLHRPPDINLWKLFKSVIPSYGDWAEQVELGSNPQHVVHSINRGSIAYAGVVPPSALLRWDVIAKEWVKV